MMRRQRLCLLAVIIVACSSPLLAEHIIVPEAAPTSGLDSQPAKSITKWTAEAGALVLLPRLLSRNPERHETGLRMLDAVIIMGGLEELLKSTFVSPRPAPFQNERHAFPSGHTSFAFAIAASLSTREPRDAYWAYPLAAAVGWSRHQLQRHTWAQVLGGAALGTYVGRRAGKGQWHLFGHNDSKLSQAAKVQAASSLLLDRQLVLWGSSF